MSRADVDMFGKSEHCIQNEIRNDLAGDVFLFRANVGAGWAGKHTKLPDGTVVIPNARRFDTGLPAGFSDLFGWEEITITPDMVGQTFARFIAIECKSATGATRDKQELFIAAVNRSGGRGGFARSVQQARDIIKGIVTNAGRGLRAATRTNRTEGGG